MPGWLPHRSGVCRARRDPGQHSASACCPQPAGKAVQRLKNVKLCLKQPPWGLPAQQAPLGTGRDSWSYTWVGCWGSHSRTEQAGDAPGGNVTMPCRMGPPGQGTLCPLWGLWAQDWVLISTHHARSAMVSLENQCRVHSLDGSVVSEEQESPSSVKGDGAGFLSSWLRFFRAQRMVAQLLRLEKELLGFVLWWEPREGLFLHSWALQRTRTLSTCSQPWLPALSLLISLERWHGANSAS